MRNIPNIEMFHEYIQLYLDIDDDFKKRYDVRLYQNCDSSSFFFELVGRTLDKRVKHDEFSGIGDLSKIEVDLVQDFNVPFVAFAGQQINYIRDSDYYFPSPVSQKEVENWLEKRGKDHISIDNFFMQAIQEGAAFKLLEFYLGCKPGEIADNLLEHYYDMKGEDWKALRCALYRYFMYSSFIQVDNSPWIKKDSIPRINLLPRLVQRFIDEYRLKEGYEKKNLVSETGESVENFLNPQKIAEQFLKFNGIDNK